MNSPFDITTAKWGNVKKVSHYDMALLPWGATEPHNGHLPYCTDVFTSTAISCEAAEQAHAKGVELMVLPGIPLGSQNPGQIELPFCIHTSQTTQMGILTDIVKSLRHQGINKLVIVSGHGGNLFKGMIRDLKVEYPDFDICHCEWYSFIKREGYFDVKDDDHAGEQETSVMMHYYPELVDMALAGDGKFNRFNIDGLNEKVAWYPRDWSKTTVDTGVGYPKKATAEKGKRYVDVVVPKIAQFLVDFAFKPLY